MLAVVSRQVVTPDFAFSGQTVRLGTRVPILGWRAQSCRRWAWWCDARLHALRASGRATRIINLPLILIVDKTLVCRSLLVIFALLSPAVASGQASDAQALAVIFGGEATANVMELRRHAVREMGERRYERLLRAVLPPGTDLIRVGIEFSPTHASPPIVTELHTSTGESGIPLNTQALFPGAEDENRDQVGGELIATAIDLVESAKSLDKLEKLRELVERRSTEDVNSRKSRLALLTLIAIAAEDFDRAKDLLGELYPLLLEVPVLRAERGPEAVAMWAGAGQAETREAARDIAFLVYEQARDQNGPRSERWHRQTYALKQLLQQLVESESGPRTSSFGTGTLRAWHRVSRVTAETCGQGYPLSRWATRAGQVDHVVGHDHDYLVYSVPLSGDFEVEADLTTFDYRDIHLAVGNVWAGPGYDLKACLSGDFRREAPIQPIDPPLTRMLDTMRARVVVRDGIRTTYINGRNVFQAAHSGDPWVAIHSPWYTKGAVRNLRIAGNADVPEEIELTLRSELPGCLPYYDESAGESDSDWQFAEASGVLTARRRADIAGSLQESLLRYHRPMSEDGWIEFDFFYAPGCSVHPALGRAAFLLRPTGVRLHWITDGRFDRTELDPANAADEPGNRRGPAALPLKKSDWNRVRVQMIGDTVRLTLNGQLIYERALEATNQRTFGLFHFADQSESRVRDIRWRGAWPRELPKPLEQELADIELEQLLDHGAELSAVFEHDFSQGVPSEFFVTGDRGEVDVEPLPHGIRMERLGGSGLFARNMITPQLKVSGDFDIMADFEQLHAKVANGGNGNVHLLVTLSDERAAACRIYRKHNVTPSGDVEQLVQSAIFQQRDNDTHFDFPTAPPEESSSGRLRLARRGTRLYYLYAADDSPYFRLIHTAEVGQAATVEGGIKLILETHQEGLTSVVWRKLLIRAESISGLAFQPSSSVAELDVHRDKLASRAEFDFSQPTELGSFARWSDQSRFQPGKDGLTIEHPGKEGWNAAGLAPRIAFAGDFDAALKLKVLHMDAPEPNRESMVHLQVEFRDELQTAVESKYVISPNGDRYSEMHLRRKKPNGEVSYESLHRTGAKTVDQLRLARRGNLLYVLFQESPDQPAQILGRVEVGAQPVPSTFLRMQVHTGGTNRTTNVLLNSLNVHAQKISGLVPLGK